MMTPGRAILVVALLCAGVGEAGHAQESPPCADSASRTLGSLRGRWDLRTVFRTTAGWDTTRGVAIMQPDLDGCLLREELVTSRGGAPFHTLSLWGAASLAGPIQRTFAHSQHGFLSVYSGRRTAAGLELRDSQVVGGRLVLLEHRFEPFVADSMRFTSRRSTDDGATWTVTWYADYVRRAP